MEIPKNVLEKLRKLLNLAEGAKAVGSLQEAENAMQKAQAILSEYNLSMDNISKEEISNSITEMDMGLDYNKRETNWIPALGDRLARYNFCQCLYSERYQKLRIFGQPHNIEMVIMMIEYIVPRIRVLARKAFSTYTGGEKRNTFLRGFYRGAVFGISERLKREQEKMIEEKPKAGELIRLTDSLVTDYISNKMGRVRESRSSSISGTSGFAQGKEVGSKISLTSRKQLG